MSSNEIARIKPAEVAETKSHDITPLRSIDELYTLVVKEWGGMDELIESARKKVQARRIKIGHLLLELQQRIDAGENGDLCTFWDWFQDMIPRSRSDAEHLMTIARQDDPEAAYQQRLEKQKEYAERHYRKKFGAPPFKAEGQQALPAPSEPELIPPSPKPKSRFPEADDDDEIIEEIVALYRRLSWGGRDKAAKRVIKLYDEWKRQ
jgi:hypothetical protein